MTTEQVPRLEVGDIAPPFEAPAADGGLVNLGDDKFAGRPHLLVFVADVQLAAARAGLDRLSAWSERLAGLGCETFVILPLVPTRAQEYIREAGLPFHGLADPNLEAARRLTPQLLAKGGPPLVSVLLRPNRHVQAVLEGIDDDHGDIACAHIETLAAQRASRRGEHHPPILMVPDVLSPKDCERLMTVFAMQGNEYVEPGHGAKGRTQDYKMRIPDYGRNDRIDHWVISQETTELIAQRLGQRLIPEIRKAFQYQATRYEHFRISRYKASDDAAGVVGAAHGHRDNSEPQVAHRRFACSINLNAESFIGGEFVFPEYGGQRYSPRTGEAIVFSSSLLHEARPVTSGTRFVLLSFLYGET
jgi:predicted 2-oxoglutarate/Fe(II)-dependent dioxygenase YbiX/peroxiredoxin